MKGLKQLKKLGMAVALASAITLVIPVTMPPSATTAMVSAATMKLSNKKLTLVAGKTKTLKVTGTKASVKWSSSDKSVATVSSKGKVTAKKHGKATITAKVGSKKLTCKVTVKAFEEETLTFNSGVNFVIPKGWYSVDASATGMERKVIALTEQSSSFLDLSVIATNPISNEDFIAYIKSTVTSETQEANLEKVLNVDLTTAQFTQEEVLEENASVVCTYIEYTTEGEPAIQVTVFDIYDGTNMYELVAMSFYESDIDYFDYISYIAENITMEE